MGIAWQVRSHDEIDGIVLQTDIMVTGDILAVHFRSKG
jgi:hypothetical protein